jgi:hypothetical protein
VPGNAARCGWLVAAAVLAMQPAAGVEREAFRVCADPNNLPFSHKNLQGFENKLAALWSERLGLPLQYTWFPQRIGFVRNTLRNKDELDDVQSDEDFLNLDNDRKARLRIAAFDQTPGPAWLSHHGMSEQMVPFQAMSGDPEDYPGKILEQALTNDQVDAAIIWGPIAGYFAKQAEDVEMVIVPLHSEPGAKFDFAISAGVRRGEDDAKEELEKLMDETSGEIQALLESYNVPLLEMKAAAAEPEDDDRD